MAEIGFLVFHMMSKACEITTFIIGALGPQLSSVRHRASFLGIVLRTAVEGCGCPLRKCISGFPCMSFWVWTTHFGGQRPWSDAVLFGSIAVCPIAWRVEGGVYSHRRGAVLSGFGPGPLSYPRLSDWSNPPGADPNIRV